MPIEAELRGFYPIDWPQLSRSVRFRRAKGRCEHCGRAHGKMVHHLGGRPLVRSREGVLAGRARQEGSHQSARAGHSACRISSFRHPGLFVLRPS